MLKLIIFIKLCLHNEAGSMSSDSIFHYSAMCTVNDSKVTKQQTQRTVTNRHENCYRWLSQLSFPSLRGR